MGIGRGTSGLDQTLLTARLDQLEPTELRVIEGGSIVGQVLYRGALVNLALRCCLVDDRELLIELRDDVEPLILHIDSSLSLGLLAAATDGESGAVLPEFCPRQSEERAQRATCRSGSSGGGTRTHNLRINSPPLCRLSYPGKVKRREVYQ